MSIANATTIVAEDHHDGRKTKASASVWGVDTPDKVVVTVTSMQGYAPGARGYHNGGVACLSAAEARSLAQLLLAAAEQAEALSA